MRLKEERNEELFRHGEMLFTTQKYMKLRLESPDYDNLLEIIKKWSSNLKLKLIKFEAKISIYKQNSNFKPNECF